MAKRVERLKADFVRKCGPAMYCDGGGLWLKVTPGSNDLNRSWVFKYAAIESDAERRQRKASGKRQKERMMGLGPRVTTAKRVPRAVNPGCGNSPVLL
jgi:hypothetical protein